MSFNYQWCSVCHRKIYDFDRQYNATPGTVQCSHKCMQLAQRAVNAFSAPQRPYECTVCGSIDKIDRMKQLAGLWVHKDAGHCMEAPNKTLDLSMARAGTFDCCFCNSPISDIAFVLHYSGPFSQPEAAHVRCCYIGVSSTPIKEPTLRKTRYPQP